jgi:antitoxin component YwqK of YwqJK toxin-antitoxin module
MRDKNLIMKKHLYIILLVLPLIGFGQNEYYENGQLKIEYKEGWGNTITKKFYNEMGNLIHEVETDSFGNETSYKRYDIKGNCELEIRKSYFKNGQLESEGEYVDGENNGYYKTFYEDGEIESEGVIKDDKIYFKNVEDDIPEWDKYELIRNGYMKHYYQGGILKKQEWWLNCVQYAPLGYDDGANDYQSIHYYPNGLKKHEEFLLNNDLLMEIYYYPNGQQKEIKISQQKVYDEYTENEYWDWEKIINGCYNENGKKVICK